MLKSYPMELPYYIINAFTDTLFSGNPACVCLLPHWLSTESLQHIAIENNMPVTAFLVKEQNHYALRWITPDYELTLCGHGTLAAAYVIFHHLASQLHKIEFVTKSGTLLVERKDLWLEMVFPEKEMTPFPAPPFLVEGLHHTPSATYRLQDERLLAVFDEEKIIREMEPDISILKKLSFRGITITAPGSKVDFVSRTFYPQKNPAEDAVTGVTHTFLAPYWSKQLGKNILSANQVSKRGGFLECEIQGQQVILRSQAVLYAEGKIIL